MHLMKKCIAAHTDKFRCSSIGTIFEIIKCLKRFQFDVIA